MKTKILSIGAALMIGCMMISSCMNDHDAPDVSKYMVTSQVSVGEVTSTIKDFKDNHAALFKQTNGFEKVDSAEVIEGVVVANDESGNLYQTLVLADINSDNTVDESHCIVLAIKNTCLYPYFAYGQKVRVNLKGLYIGCYSKMPKIGEPYYTSNNNLRLGPVLFERCKTNIQLIGKPADYASKIQPLKIADNDVLFGNGYQNYKNAPMLVTVEGTFTLGDDTTPLATDAEKDAGMGVDREFKVGNNTITVRTSVNNEVSFLKMPKGKVRLTGVISYYSGWQMQLRSAKDMEKIN